MMSDINPTLYFVTVLTVYQLDVIYSNFNLNDEAHEMKRKQVTKDLMQKTLHWFAHGRVGSSSKFMATYITIGAGDKSHPHDPDDLNRCLLLLIAVPELRDHMYKLRSVSKQWEQLVDNWDSLESCFINEAGLNWSKAGKAPITYKAMKQMGC
ncbi:hypothetical protein VPHK233G2_0051 [Vibrio phage K233 g2]